MTRAATALAEVLPVADAASATGAIVSRAPPIARLVTPAAAGDASVEKVARFTWSGSPWALIGTCLFNALMTVVTVGVYSFWGRTEIRRRLWSSIRLNGEPLAYHGTGKELFKGFVAALLVVLLPLFIAGTATVIWFGHASTGWGFYQLGLFLVVYPVLKALATYRARRFRLSRTSWRGVRGSMLGSSGEFAFLSWATAILYPLTLGWIAPWRSLYIQRFLTNDTVLGDRKLEMAGSTLRLYLRFAALWVMTVLIGLAAAGGIYKLYEPYVKRGVNVVDILQSQPELFGQAIGIAVGAVFIWYPISAFYKSALYNLCANATMLTAPEGAPAGAPIARFKLETRGLSLLWLLVTNQLITYGSFFVLRPIATARAMRYFTTRLSIVGALDIAEIKQNSKAALDGGEGLAQAFDFDAF